MLFYNFINLYLFCKMDNKVDVFINNGKKYYKDYNMFLENMNLQTFKYISKEAHNGCKMNQYVLASCHKNGKFVPINTNNYIYWITKSAENNDSSAQNDLAFCYQEGLYIEKNEKLSFEWYKKAAENNNVNAQCIIAFCYEHGQGVKENWNLSFEWYKKAAEQNDLHAQLQIAMFYTNGFGIEKNDKLAFEWYKKAADQNNSEAQCELAICYEEGKGVDKNEKLALKWYKKSAGQNYEGAQYKLALFYEEGKGTEKNIKKAHKLYYKLYKQYEYNAYRCLPKIMEYYKLYCDTNVKHMYNLGVCYQILKQYQDAYECYEESAYLKYPPAQYALGYCYEKGIYVNSSIKESKIWYQLSADNGFEPANTKLWKLNLKKLEQYFKKKFENIENVD